MNRDPADYGAYRRINDENRYKLGDRVVYVDDEDRRKAGVVKVVLERPAGYWYQIEPHGQPGRFDRVQESRVVTIIAGPPPLEI
jgi:hypothetical protein